MTNAHQKYPNRLRKTIKQSGFTIEQIAAETEIPLRTLFDYCAGRVPIPRNRLEVLASTLGYPTEYLVLTYSDSDTAYSLKPAVQIDNSSPTNRRDEVTSLFSNIAARNRSAQLSSIDEATPADLESFATLTDTCRRLSEGNELGIAENILWSYLPRIASIATYSLREPKPAASIASQGYLLAASLAGHCNDLHARQHYSEQALLYGEIAQDDALQVAAFRQLATTFNYLRLPHKVMQTYQRALPHLDKVPPLLRSCIYAALSGVYAQFQQGKDADHFIGLAYESFGEHQGDEPDFLRAINASQNLLIHWDGRNHLQLGRPRQAEKIFLRLDVLDPSMPLPKRIRVEAIDSRAKMFIAVGNMEQACLYLEIAVQLAVEIGSSLRLREVAATFQSLKSTWPYEERVRKSSDLFIQHLINHGH